MPGTRVRAGKRGVRWQSKFIPYSFIPYSFIPYSFIPYSFIPYSFVPCGTLSRLGPSIRTPGRYPTTGNRRFRVLHGHNLANTARKLKLIRHAEKETVEIFQRKFREFLERAAARF